MASAWDSFNATGIGEGYKLDQALMQLASDPSLWGGNMAAVSPDGRWQINPYTYRPGTGRYEGDNWIYDDLPGYQVFDLLTPGGQNTNYNFDANGGFQNSWTGSDLKLTDMLGPALVGGLALGAGSLFGSAGGGAAGGAGVTGLGDAGMMYAGETGAGLMPEVAITETGALGGSGGFLGDATAWGYGGAPDAFGATGASTMGGGASVGGGTALGSAPGGGSFWDYIKSGASNLTGNGGGVNWLGLGTTALGALGGAQGQSADTSATRQLPSYLQGPVANDLVPRAQGLLSQQMPGAMQAGQQLMTMGSGLLGQSAPTTAQNPYLSSVADDMQRRTQDLLGQNNLAIQGNFVGSGGLGSSRQGVAQGVAAGRAADSLQGNVAGLYGNAYNQDQSRLRQDWTIGSGLLNQGLNTPYQPLKNTSEIFQPYTGFGTTSQNQSSGGGWQGAVGGALSGAALGRQMGWW